MLDSSARADIAVGHFFMSGFEAVADSLKPLDKVRILVGRADRTMLESVAEALKARLEADCMVQRRQRESIAREPVDGFAAGVSLLPQTGVAVGGARTPRPRCVGAGGGAGLPAYRRSPLHAKPTCAGTTITPSRARRWSARPT